MHDFFPRVWSRFSAGGRSWRAGALLLLLLEADAEVALADPHGELERRPVVLVHGIHDTARSMEPMAAWLRERGWQVHTLSLTPNDGRVGLDVLAEQLHQFVDKSFSPDTKLDLVGFSMGGLVSRYYLQRLGGAERVERFVTISSPHHGTWWAYLHWGAGGVQMRPGSAFLQDLNEDGRWLEQVQVTSLWTPLDLMIVPALSSHLEGAQERQCWVFAHPLMVLQSNVLKEVEEALSCPK